MSFFSRFAPIRAVKDLRSYLQQRPPYEVVFLALAIMVASGVILAFAHDSKVAPVYRPQIIYVQQWRSDRTDAEIRAQQVIDEAAKQKRLAAEKAQRDAVQAQFKKIDDKLKNMGI